MQALGIHSSTPAQKPLRRCRARSGLRPPCESKPTWNGAAKATAASYHKGPSATLASIRASLPKTCPFMLHKRPKKRSSMDTTDKTTGRGTTNKT